MKTRISTVKMDNAPRYKNRAMSARPQCQRNAKSPRQDSVIIDVVGETSRIGEPNALKIDEQITEMEMPKVGNHVIQIEYLHQRREDENRGNDEIDNSPKDV